MSRINNEQFDQHRSTHSGEIQAPQTCGFVFPSPDLLSPTVVAVDPVAHTVAPIQAIDSDDVSGHVLCHVRLDGATSAARPGMFPPAIGLRLCFSDPQLLQVLREGQPQPGLWLRG